MNPPTAMTRFLGKPRVLAAMYVSCALAVVGWFGGAVPWWLAIISLCFLGTVKKSLAEVRRYDAWAAEWRRMGGAPAPSSQSAADKRQRRVRKPSSRWTCVIAAALLLCPIIPFFAASAASDGARNALTLLWLATAVYLVCKVVLNLRPARDRTRAGTVSAGQSKTSAPADDIVAWMLPPASSSPSRADIIRALPEHCLRLMGN